MLKIHSIPSLQREYDQLARRVSHLGLISQGSVQDRTQRPRSGAGYQWTRKVAAKTVTVALTQEQFSKMRQAVANYRQLRRLLKKMEKISRSIIFQTAPHTARHKRLSRQVLGTM
jgi:hypothetical protein